MKRRIWLALVAFAMLLTVLPMSAFGIQLDEDIPIQTDFVNEAVATQENSPKTGEFYTIEGLGSIESVIPFSQLPSTLNLAQNPSFSYGSSWTKKVYYNQLDAVSKAVYDQIANSELAQGPINKQITINLSGIGTVDYMTILAALGALVYDYPEYSWLVNTGPEMYWDDNSVDFGLNQESVKKATVDVDEIPTTVTNRYYYANTGTLADITATVNRVKCEIDATLPTNPSDYITIKAIHDWICSNVEYTNTDGDRFKNNWRGYQTVYSALVEHKTVCTGYAKAFKLLCDAYQIPCVIVTGTANNGKVTDAHAWNYVRVNGNWYAVDCTWDDAVTYTRYDYFLIGSTALKKDHTEGTLYAGCAFRYPVLSGTNYVEPGGPTDIIVTSDYSTKETAFAAPTLIDGKVEIPVTAHLTNSNGDSFAERDSDITWKFQLTYLTNSDYRCSISPDGIVTIPVSALACNTRNTAANLTYTFPVILDVTYGSIKKEYTIYMKVGPIRVASVEICKDDTVITTDSVRMGSTASYTTRITNQYGAALKDTQAVAWEVSNPDLASVDTNGTVTLKDAAKDGDTFDVTATSGGVVSTVKVTVSDKPAHDLTVPAELTFTYGTPQNINAGSETGAAFTYASDNAGVATVDANGNVTPVSVGTANIQVTAVAGNTHNSTTKTVLVTVEPKELTDSMVPVSSTTFVYDGQAQMPEVGGILKKDVDYEISYSDSPINVGAYTMTITGKGNYTGTVTKTITITEATPTVTANPGTPSIPTVTIPVSGDQTSVQVSATVSGNTATVSKIDTTQIENVIGGDVRTGIVEIDFTGLNTAINTVNLPANSIGEVAAAAQSPSNDVTGLSVKLSDGEITFDGTALAAIQAQAATQITLSVAPAKTSDLNSRQREIVGNAPVFDLTIRSGGNVISDFRGGYATVSLPYTLAPGQNPAGVVVYYLDANGNIQKCDTMYDVRSQSVIFTTGHLSLYFVGYDETAVVTPWENPFPDVSEDTWYYDAVRFVSENGLMNGYNSTQFGPNDNLSRAQLAQILYNREGQPAVAVSSVFTDVDADMWYANAINWAAANGIVTGYGGGLFGPNDNITREQLAIMLWRYAGKPTSASRELAFTDAGDVSDYALEALYWAVENGVIGGYNGQLEPKDFASRSQVAQMLKNYFDK